MSKKIPTLEDVIDYVKVWRGFNISETERRAILNVCRIGESYGYGNMMSWLMTAWDLDFKPKRLPPMSPRKVTAYPIPAPTEEEAK
jgi:hypothetical protein